MAKLSIWYILRHAWGFEVTETKFYILTPFFALRVFNWGKDIFADVLVKGVEFWYMPEWLNFQPYYSYDVFFKSCLKSKFKFITLKEVYENSCSR